MMDVCQDFLRRGQGQTAGDVSVARPDAGLCLIRNETGDDLDRLSVVALGDPLILPSDSEDNFVSRVALAGNTPTSDDAGTFAILLEPVADGSIGTGLLSGVCPVQLDVVSS